MGKVVSLDDLLAQRQRMAMMDSARAGDVEVVLLASSASSSSSSSSAKPDEGCAQDSPGLMQHTDSPRVMQHANTCNWPECPHQKDALIVSRGGAGTWTHATGRGQFAEQQLTQRPKSLLRRLTRLLRAAQGG